MNKNDEQQILIVVLHFILRKSGFMPNELIPILEDLLHDLRTGMNET